MEREKIQRILEVGRVATSSPGNMQPWRAVVVTNQPVVAKGWATEADVQTIHNKLETLLGLEHAFLDRVYYCPHHPDAGFPGERKELKIRCDCRKPAIGMIGRAVAELNIDLAQSWLVGDTTTDVDLKQKQETTVKTSDTNPVAKAA